MKQQVITIQKTSKKIKFFDLIGKLTMIFSVIAIFVGAQEPGTDTAANAVVFFVIGGFVWMMARVAKWWNHE